MAPYLTLSNQCLGIPFTDDSSYAISNRHHSTINWCFSAGGNAADEAGDECDEDFDTVPQRFPKLDLKLDHKFCHLVLQGEDPTIKASKTLMDLWTQVCIYVYDCVSKIVDRLWRLDWWCMNWCSLRRCRRHTAVSWDHQPQSGGGVPLFTGCQIVFHTLSVDKVGIHDLPDLVRCLDLCCYG